MEEEEEEEGGIRGDGTVASSHLLGSRKRWRHSTLTLYAMTFMLYVEVHVYNYIVSVHVYI